VFSVAASAVIDAAGKNFYPSVGSALIDAGSTGYTSPATRDYNGSPRTDSTPTVGAYVRSPSLSLSRMALMMAGR
jgi:hypothetical protein